MKKLLLSFLALVMAVTVTQAQNAKGGLLLYGDFGYTMGKFNQTLKNTTPATSANKTINYNATLGVGYLVGKNVAVGLNGMVDGSSYTDDSVVLGNFETTVTEVAFGPFVRYYYRVSDLIYIFGQLDVNYLRGTTDYYYRGPGTNTTQDYYDGIGARFFPAIGFNIKSGIALNFTFGGVSYKTYDLTYDFSRGSVKYNQLDFTLGHNITIGIQKTFNFPARRMRGTGAEPMSDTRNIDTSDDDDQTKTKTKTKVKRKKVEEDEE